MIRRFEKILPDAIKKRHHRKIVGLGDWINLVIVAFSTTHRRAHEGLRSDVDNITNSVSVSLRAICRFVIPLHERHKSGGDTTI